jgi:hypothetical protein
MLTYADVCGRMLTYAYKYSVCAELAVKDDALRATARYADVCSRMQTCADVC